MVILLGGSGWGISPIFADVSAPPGAIKNTATGSFVDELDSTNTAVPIQSNEVSVTVVEVAGITVTLGGTSGSMVTGSIAYFDFVLTNVGNDPTQFFIPDAPSAITGGTKSGDIKIISYDSDGSGTTAAVALDVAVPANGGNTGTLLSGVATANNGSIPAGATIRIRVPVLISATSGNVSVTMGDTTANAQNQPYTAGTNDVYTVDNLDIVVGEAAGVPFNGGTEASATQTVTVSTAPISVSGAVFSDADANVAIDGTDAGTNAGSVNLTIYAIDTATNKVVDKATVAANGTYTLANVPASTTVKLRLANDATFAIGATAPTAPSLPSGWFHTGKNLNGTIDGTIATLGDIAITTTTANLTAQNFGIRPTYVLPTPPVPTVCAANFTTNLNTGIDASGGQLGIGANDLNWSAEWLTGPTSGTGTPFSLPRPVGIMPAVVTGNLAPGAWIDELPNARWISYPFRLPFNSNGNHTDADLDGAPNETTGAGANTTDAVRLKFTAKLTLPSNAGSIAVSLPVGVSVDNRFVSLKINGVENLSPIPAQNPYATDFTSTQSVNIQNGWQPGVNTIEVVVDSGPDRVGFFLAVQATTTQLCPSPNLLLVKRITAINGSTTTSGGDNLAMYKDESSSIYDDNLLTTPAPIPPDTDKWPVINGFPFMIGGTNGGNVKPKDSIEYTIYFLSTGDSAAKKVLFCDRVPDHVTFIPNAFNSVVANPDGLPAADRGIAINRSGTINSYTNLSDGDIARYYPPLEPLPDGCKAKSTDPPLPNPNGAVVVSFGSIPNATTAGEAGTYGFVRFRGQLR
jgi:uncharacterized repeat protein (TIGR01451 family)